MVNEKLLTEVGDFKLQAKSLSVLANELAIKLGDAIIERLMELFKKREHKDVKFAMWLADQFNYDTYVAWDIFTKDSILICLLQAVDATQKHRYIVAIIVNKQLAKIPSSIGVGKMFTNTREIDDTGAIR